MNRACRNATDNVMFSINWNYSKYRVKSWYCRIQKKLSIAFNMYTVLLLTIFVSAYVTEKNRDVWSYLKEKSCDAETLKSSVLISHLLYIRIIARYLAFLWGQKHLTKNFGRKQTKKSVIFFRSMKSWWIELENILNHVTHFVQKSYFI